MRKEDYSKEAHGYYKNALKVLKTQNSYTNLTLKQQEVINLYYYKGLTQHLIAQRLEISQQGVSHLLNRAKQAIRRGVSKLHSGKGK